MEQTLIYLFLGMYGLLLISLYKIFRIEAKIGSEGKKVEYNPAITIWKFITQVIFGGVSLTALELITNFSTVLQQWKSVGIIFLIAFLTALNNYIKYR